MNNKGFTVIELIMSFLFATILALSLFSVVVVYKEKQTDSSIETDLLAFKSQLTIDVQNDIGLRGLKDVDYCRDGNSFKSRCVIMTFNDNSKKDFYVEYDSKNVSVESDTFNLTYPYIVYGGVRYDIPYNSQNIYIDDGYILQTSSPSDGLETNTKLFRINFALKHSDLDEDINISIVANGTQAISNEAVRDYNIGDVLYIQVNNEKQLKFRVIANSFKFQNKVTLLYDHYSDIDSKYTTNYDNSLLNQPLVYNNYENLGNRYKNSSIKTAVTDISTSWNNVDEVRLITVEEIASLASFGPQYRGEDSDNISLATAYDWLKNKNYWTMTEKITSSDNGKSVWVVKGSDSAVTGAQINENYYLRPVIVVDKSYILNPKNI